MMNLKEAIQKMKAWAASKRGNSSDAGACFAYLRAIPDAIELGATLPKSSAMKGLRTQLLYAISNAQYWRGPEAKEAKATIRQWIKDNS